MKKIVVIAEYIENKIRPITDELVACALQISAITPSEVTLLHTNDLTPLESQSYRSYLAQILAQIGPDFVIMGHTSQGVDVAPGLALRLGYTCITGVNKISHAPETESQITESHSNSCILFSRSVFKGRLNAVVCLATPEEPALLTIEPGSFSMKRGDGSGDNDDTPYSERYCTSKEIASGTTEAHVRSALPCPTEPPRSAASSHTVGSASSIAIGYPIEYGTLTRSSGNRSKLNQAKIIVAAGRGIGDRENIAHIEKLSSCFTNSAVAGSRPLIDMGWMPYEQQVGITGTLVSPEIYMAVGISGSSQHVAGMKDSKFIISVNKDPNAAIFNLSDISIVEDSIHFIETFIEISEK